MRIPYAWLKSHCDPEMTPERLAVKLALSTAEVEKIERVGVGDPERFVIGKVLTREQHPNADRLSVCTVDTGEGDPRTIVCGAPNVAAGQTVGVALPGAVMPDGNVLGEAKLRGIASSGMILAEDEVGVGHDHDGIFVLPDSFEVGAPLLDAVTVFDEVLDLEINPNRPDLFSVYGVAREVHTITGNALAPDPSDDDAEPSGSDKAADHVSIDIDPEVCLRFTGRVFEDVKIGPSPLWLKQRLIAAGQRPISNVVDITNYVMLETGQPLHAFDLDKVRGNQIIVRRAREGEGITTLDDVERTLDPSIAVVGDAEGPSGIAGIMGGQISEVSDTTTRVLMEAATWVAPNIMRSQAKLGLRSEASTRFEKGLHPDNAMAGQRLAARLMVELAGARLVPGTIDVYPRPADPRVVTLRHHRIGKLLGVEVPPERVAEILSALGFGVHSSGADYEVTIPYWRDGDVQREADLIEEVGRIYGLDKIPATLPERPSAVGHLNPSQTLRRRLEDELRGRGYAEIIAWSFTAPSTFDRLRLGGEPMLRLENPLSEEQSVMRPLLLSGLLDAAARNHAHGRSALRLFESAHAYRPGDPADDDEVRDTLISPRGKTPAHERHHIGALLTQAAPATWRSAEAPADFYAAKGVLEALLAPSGVAWSIEPGERPFLHPGRSAILRAGDGHELGWIGEVHPLVARAWDIPAATAFEVDVDLLVELDPGPAIYRNVTSFPAVRQDIAVVVGSAVSAAEVEDAVRKGGGELLRSVRVFDLYEGDQVGAGKKSLALRLEFRADDRTLTDEDVAGLRSAIEGELGSIGGALRA